MSIGAYEFRILAWKHQVVPNATDSTLLQPITSPVRFSDFKGLKLEPT